jgi:hypothetical protein
MTRRVGEDTAVVEDVAVGGEDVASVLKSG